jgi:U3 small nucleolar RNA-associated protein 14
MKRKEGFYWVKVDNSDWQIANYRFDVHLNMFIWNVTNDEYDYEEDSGSITEIDEHQIIHKKENYTTITDKRCPSCGANNFDGDCIVCGFDASEIDIF